MLWHTYSYFSVDSNPATPLVMNFKRFCWILREQCKNLESITLLTGLRHAETIELQRDLKKLNVVLVTGVLLDGEKHPRRYK